LIFHFHDFCCFVQVDPWPLPQTLPVLHTDGTTISKKPSAQRPLAIPVQAKADFNNMCEAAQSLDLMLAGSPDQAGLLGC